MTATGYLLSEGEFASAWESASTMVALGATFPDSPFLRPGGYFLVCDFDWLTRPAFAPVLSDLSRQFGDEQLVLLSDAPPGEGFRVPAPEIESAYLEILDFDPDAADRPLSIVSSGIVVFGDTQRWTIRGIRAGELAVVRTEQETVLQGRYKEFLDIDVAVDELVRLSMKPQFYTPELLERYRASFPTKLPGQHG